MKKKYLAILAIAAALGALFLGYQNFTFEKEKTNKMELSSAIEDTLTDRQQLQKEIRKDAPAKMINADGLIRKNQQMKRTRIEDTAETVFVPESKFEVNPKFRDPASVQGDEDIDSKAIKRVEDELNEE